MLALPTRPLTDAQIRYNELSEAAFTRFRQARVNDEMHARKVYGVEIEAARNETGCDHLMLVDAER